MLTRDKIWVGSRNLESLLPNSNFWLGLPLSTLVMMSLGLNNDFYTTQSNIYLGELELKTGIWKDDQVKQLDLRKALSPEWLYRLHEDKRSAGNRSKLRSMLTHTTWLFLKNIYSLITVTNEKYKMCYLLHIRPKLKIPAFIRLAGHHLILI